MSETATIEQPTATADSGKVVKIGKIAKSTIPPAFSERCVVRVTGHKFGPNSNQNPMITIDCELVGFFPSAGEKKGQLLGTVEKNGQTYVLSGLQVRSSFFTLEGGGLTMYAEFWNKAHPGEELTELDVSNPDRTYLTGLLMQCVVSGRSEVYRSQLTDDEKAAKKLLGERPVGDPILDDQGKPIEIPVIQISKWLVKYVGELPAESENQPY